MKALDRYILRETLVPSLIAVVVLTFVIFTRQMGALFELIVRQSATRSEIWAISAAVLPNALALTIPMAVLVGILAGFGRISSDHEIVALRAAGISMNRVLKPVLILALLAGSLNLALSLWIAPTAAARLGDLKQAIALRQVSFEIKPLVFNETLPGLALYVADASGDGKRWEGILLAEMSNPNEPRVTFARSGTLYQDPGTGFLVALEDGSTHIVSQLLPERYSYSSFRSTIIPLAVPLTEPPPKEPEPVERTTGELWVPIWSGTATYEERREFHRRTALPFACIAFALVGLPLGVTTRRGGKSMGLVISLLLMLAYYLIFVAGTHLSAASESAVFFGTWAGNISFALLGLVLLARSERQSENRVLTRLAGSMDSIRSRAASLPFVELSLGRWTAALTHRSKWFRVLDLYVLMGFWFFFALVLAVFVSLFVLVTLFELLADIVKNDVDAEIVARYFFFLLPQVLYYVIPLTVLMAVLINLGTLTKTNEILAVKASAISLYRVAMPVVIMGLVLSVGLYGLQDFLLPVSNQLQDEYRNTIKGRASQTYRDPDRKWMVGSNDQIYHYRYFDPDQNVFGGISVFEFEPARFKLRRWVFATRAAWDDAAWVFEDGWIRTLRPDGSVNYQAFDDVAFDGMVDGPEHFKKDVRTAQQMTYLELRRYIQDLRQSGFDVNDLTVELHRKLSFPLVSFIMAVIGIPFSFMTGKRGAFYGIGMCVVTGIFYWSTFELFDKLGGVERLSPVIAAWFPNLIFGSLGLWLLLRVKT